MQKNSKCAPKNLLGVQKNSNVLSSRAAAMYAPTPQSVERSWNTQTVKRQSLSPPPLATTTSLSNGGHHNDDPSEVEPPKKKVYSQQPKQVKRPANSKFVPLTFATNSSDICYFCGKKVYLMERMSANGFFFHRMCFRCCHCNCQLKIGGYSLSKGQKREVSIPPFPFHNGETDVHNLSLHTAPTKHS